MMWNKKSNLDEMQEQKLLHIEKKGFWFLYFGLAVMILGQRIIYRNDFEAGTTACGGELILLLISSIYVVAACVKNGIWDRHLKSDVRTNFLISLVTSIVFGLVVAIIGYLSWHELLSALITWVITAIFMFGLLFATLSIMAYFYKKRVEKLEEEDE